MGFAIQMSISIDFYVVQFIVKIIAKKNHYVLKVSLLPTLEAHLALKCTTTANEENQNSFQCRRNKI